MTRGEPQWPLRLGTRFSWTSKLYEVYKMGTRQDNPPSAGWGRLRSLRVSRRQHARCSCLRSGDAITLF